MHVEIETRNGLVLARVRETQIGAESADEFRNQILGHLSKERPRLAIDLSTVDFMDSSGLGALVSLLKTVRPRGEMVLYGMRSGVREILRLTHLDSVFRCTEDETQALTALDEAGSAAS